MYGRRWNSFTSQLQWFSTFFPDSKTEFSVLACLSKIGRPSKKALPVIVTWDVWAAQCEYSMPVHTNWDNPVWKCNYFIKTCDTGLKSYIFYSRAIFSVEALAAGNFIHILFSFHGDHKLQEENIISTMFSYDSSNLEQWLWDILPFLVSASLIQCQHFLFNGCQVQAKLLFSSSNSSNSSSSKW